MDEAIAGKKIAVEGDDSEITAIGEDVLRDGCSRLDPARPGATL